MLGYMIFITYRQRWWFRSHPAYDVLANLTLDLYCGSLISVTQLLPRGAVPAPIKTSKSLNEDEVYIFSYNRDEYLFQEIHVKSIR